MVNLSLNQKLRLSSRRDCVTLFSDREFLRVYNQSAYILVNHLNVNCLKPRAFYAKYPPYSLIIMVSLSVASLERQLPKAEATSFGYIVQGDYDLVHYHFWESQQKLTLQRTVSSL